MSFVVSALTEEGLKAIVLIPCLLNEKNFNERLDAIVYSVFLTLGFATVENIIYIVYGNYNEAINLAITRGIISIPAHIMFAITMGYYIAKYKFSNQKRENLFLAILLPILQHGIFNFILMIKNKFSLWIFIIYTVVLMKLCLDKLDMYVKDSKKKHT
jgi:RsiW-degrading membrane proteinase PrsW (M82 family)